MTALGGLPVYLDMARVIGLKRSISEHLGVREAGQGRVGETSRWYCP